MFYDPPRRYCVPIRACLARTIQSRTAAGPTESVECIPAVPQCRCAEDAVVLRQLRGVNLVAAFLWQSALPALPSPRIAVLDRQAVAEIGAGRVFHEHVHL